MAYKSAVKRGVSGYGGISLGRAIHSLDRRLSGRVPLSKVNPALTRHGLAIGKKVLTAIGSVLIGELCRGSRGPDKTGNSSYPRLKAAEKGRRMPGEVL